MWKCTDSCKFTVWKISIFVSKHNNNNNNNECLQGNGIRIDLGSSLPVVRGDYWLRMSWTYTYTQHYFLPKSNPQPTPSINLVEGIKCTIPMTMENKVIRASGTASCMQRITELAVWELDIQRKMCDSFPCWLVEQVAPSHARVPQGPVASPYSIMRPQKLRLFPSPFSGPLRLGTHNSA